MVFISPDSRPCARAVSHALPIALLVLAAALPFSASPAEAADPLEPVVVIDQASGSGPVVGSDGTIFTLTVTLGDSTGRDTVPSRSTLTFHWHAEPGMPTSHVAQYRYKLDEPQFVTVDSSVHSVVYSHVAAGPKLFEVQAVDDLDHVGRARLRFMVDFAPSTQYAGPDPAAFPLVAGERVLDVPDWRNCPPGGGGLGSLAPLQGSLLSIDSLTVLPARRVARRTFYEIYGNRLFVRQPGDTVHMNSWLVFHPRGEDLDSPYHVPLGVTPALQDTNGPCGSTLPMVGVHDSGPNGSAIGARFTYWTQLNTHRVTNGVPQDVIGGTVPQPLSSLLPVFDPALVQYWPAIAAYIPANVAGTVYFAFNAVDGDGASDTWFRKISSTRDTFFIDSVRAGDAAADDARMIAFHVDFPPRLAKDAPGFAPRADTTFQSRDDITFHLYATDADPWIPGDNPVGGPVEGVMRRTVWITGRTLSNPDRDTTFVPDGAFRVDVPDIPIRLPDNVVGPTLTAGIELCDCDNCEDLDGSGRCIYETIPFHAPGIFTPVLVSLAGATIEPDGVHLRWRLAPGVAARVERRAAGSAWLDRGALERNGEGDVSWIDGDVAAGERYGYRLAVRGPGIAGTAGETWVDVPVHVLALEGTRPNPAPAGRLAVRLSLAHASPARLELFDLAGRRVALRELRGFEAGEHTVSPGEARLAPGVYLARLTQGAEARSGRIVVIE